MTLLATGSEVSLAVAGRQAAARGGDQGRRRLDALLGAVRGPDEAYRDAGARLAPRASAVEAAVGFGWRKWLGPEGAFVGMRGFGASAPAQDLYKHFGITAEAVAQPPRDLTARPKK